MIREELFNRGLPKWPQMLVTGVPVSKEQAMEIIRRTDSFFDGYGGNNHNFNHMVRQELHIPVYNYSEYPECEKYNDFDTYWKARNSWLEHWGYIETNYVHNDWISSCFVFGPNGWCHPDGNIGYIDNVGKWPEIEEIYNDWVKLAKEFPFLDIGVTLMNDESCEDNTSPVTSFAVKNGIVEIVDPSEINVHENHPEPTRNENGASMSFSLDVRKENAIPMFEILKWKKFLK